VSRVDGRVYKELKKVWSHNYDLALARLTPSRLQGSFSDAEFVSRRQKNRSTAISGASSKNQGCAGEGDGRDDGQIEAGQHFRNLPIVLLLIFCSSEMASWSPLGYQQIISKWWRTRKPVDIAWISTKEGLLDQSRVLESWSTTRHTPNGSEISIYSAESSAGSNQPPNRSLSKYGRLTQQVSPNRILGLYPILQHQSHPPYPKSLRLLLSHRKPPHAHPSVK